ncbi:MAG: thiamine phosphate synthase [Gammaproteobacteria bacterium]|nr:thiamine phosphate synthase [Gammaproteobacteria bacterium]
MIPLPARGLYAIADTAWVGPERIVAAIAGAIAGGAAMIQLRDKRGHISSHKDCLLSLVETCHENGVPFIINDDTELAVHIGADGVHVGQTDGDIAAIRKRLGPDAIIGVSCHDDIDSAHAAVSRGADYVAFGRFFPSLTKPDAPAADIGILGQARASVDVPIVAIGGITPDNGALLLAAGADLLAVIAGIFDQPDSRAAAAAYRNIFQQSS